MTNIHDLGLFLESVQDNITQDGSLTDEKDIYNNVIRVTRDAKDVRDEKETEEFYKIDDIFFKLMEYLKKDKDNDLLFLKKVLRKNKGRLFQWIINRIRESYPNLVIESYIIQKKLPSIILEFEGREERKLPKRLIKRIENKKIVNIYYVPDELSDEEILRMINNGNRKTSRNVEFHLVNLYKLNKKWFSKIIEDIINYS
jgi:hypothetical protein